MSKSLVTNLVALVLTAIRFLKPFDSNLILKEDLEKNFFCCPKCGDHHKLTCVQRFNTFFDSDYTILETPNPVDDVLGFKDKKSYKDRLETARKLTKQRDIFDK